MPERKPSPSEDERVKRATAPGERAPGLHAFYRGKIEASAFSLPQALLQATWAS
jgi:hypothetical protein